MKPLLFFAAALLLAGCATVPDMPMSTVMRRCEHLTNFTDYSRCIRVTYDNEGNDPSGPSVRAFYALMAEIEEANQKGVMSNIQAKAAAHRAFMNTVDADNNRNRGTFCTVIGNILVCN